MNDLWISKNKVWNSKKSLECKDQTTTIILKLHSLKLKYNLILKFQRTFLNNKVWM